MTGISSSTEMSPDLLRPSSFHFASFSVSYPVLLVLLVWTFVFLFQDVEGVHFNAGVGFMQNKLKLKLKLSCPQNILVSHDVVSLSRENWHLWCYPPTHQLVWLSIYHLVFLLVCKEEWHSRQNVLRLSTPILSGYFSIRPLKCLFNHLRTWIFFDWTFFFSTRLCIIFFAFQFSQWPNFFSQFPDSVVGFLTNY